MYARREPAMVLAAVAAIIQVLSAFVFDWTDEQQGVLNAVAVAVAGIATAAIVSVDKALPLLAGLAQAVFAVGVAWGFELDPVAEASVMALLAAVVAMFVRTQVTAPVGPLVGTRG